MVIDESSGNIRRYWTAVPSHPQRASQLRDELGPPMLLDSLDSDDNPGGS